MRQRQALQTRALALTSVSCKLSIIIIHPFYFKKHYNKQKRKLPEAPIESLAGVVRKVCFGREVFQYCVAYYTN